MTQWADRLVKHAKLLDPDGTDPNATGGGGSGSTLLELYPSSDAYINSQSATSNFDAGNDALIGNAWSTNSFTRYILQTYDISSLAGAAVVWAGIRLTRHDSSGSGPGAGGGAGVAMNVKEILRAYNPTQVTWNVYSTGNNWTTVGGQGAGTDTSSTQYGVASIPDDVAGTKYTIGDIAALLQAKILASETTLRVMIGPSVQTEGQNLINFWSVEATSEADRPQLLVLVTTEGATTAPVAASKVYAHQTFR